ncbi:MAG: sulfatase [Bacteroidota bacterium]
MITCSRYLVLLYGLLLVGCGSTTSDALDKPNIVLIYIDDLGWRDVGFNGSTYYETPNIDSLASAGIVFTNGYANAPNCAPSRASLMTGMYAPRHGIYTVASAARGKAENRKMIPVENETTLDLDFVTLAEALQGAGYTTGHFGKWHLGHEGNFPEDQGFDVNVAGHHRGSPPGGHFSPYKNPTLDDGPEGEYLTDRLTDEALAFIEQYNASPFFLYLTHYAVHTPIQGQEDRTARYQEKPATDDQQNATYAAMIESVDIGVGRVLESLDALGLTENTLVIFYSDNGGAIQATSNAPLRGYKGMLYEGGIRVPLAMKWPAAIPAGQADDTPVIGTDFYPTFAQIAGFALPQQKDGESLLPLITGEGKLGARNLHWHFPAYLEKAGPMTEPWRTTPAAAIRSGEYKLIEFFEDNRLELYNLSTDPGESRNLAAEMPDKVAALHKMMEDWRIATDAAMPTMKPEYADL